MQRGLRVYMLLIKVMVMAMVMAMETLLSVVREVVCRESRLVRGDLLEGDMASSMVSKWFKSCLLVLTAAYLE